MLIIFSRYKYQYHLIFNYILIDAPISYYTPGPAQDCKDS